MSGARSIIPACRTAVPRASVSSQIISGHSILDCLAYGASQHQETKVKPVNDSIRKTEDALFDDWESAYIARTEDVAEAHGTADVNRFIRDGVVDPRQYVRAEKKLVLVLKEAADWGGRGDLREFLRCGGQWKTWNNVTRWVEGILDDLPWNEIDAHIDNERRKRALRRVAVVNLKKSYGAGTANDRLIREAARADRDFIRKQLALYEPDLVICGGEIVGSAFVEDVYGCDGNVWQLSSGDAWSCRINGILHVCHYHPGYWAVSPKILLEGLVNTLKDSATN